MSPTTVAQAQADMRAAYLLGGPVVAASALAWLLAAAAARVGTPKAAMWARLIGGAFVLPASVLLPQNLGRSGKHAHGNPLAGGLIELAFAAAILAQSRRRAA